MTSLERTFSRIYRRNLWNGVESRSGPGSGFAATRRTAEYIEDLVARERVGSVLNIGCGEDLWLPDLPGYVGIDVTTEPVLRAIEAHPRRVYWVWNAVESLPPGGPWDLVLIRDVIQHLPMADGLRLLDNVRRSGSRLLLASTYTGTSEANPRDLANIDIRPGECYSPVLTEPPFGWPEPVEWVVDGWDYDTGTTVRDGAKRLALWRLR